MKTEINENEVVNGIKVKDWKQFLQLYCAMSPENVCCDGEISRAEANRRYRALVKQWKALERKVGRKVDSMSDEFFEVIKRF